MANIENDVMPSGFIRGTWGHGWFDEETGWYVEV